MRNRMKSVNPGRARAIRRLARMTAAAMIMLLGGLPLAAAAAAETPAAAPAAETPAANLPAAEQIIERAIAACGGREALEKIHSRVTRGVLEIPAVGIKAALTVYTAAPNKVFNVAESDALGRIASGTDGAVYWESSAMTGPRIKEGEERAAAIRESTFHNDLEWRSLYKQAETVGVATIGDRECYQVAMTPTEGKVEHFYYDMKDHFLRKTQATLVSPMGEISVEAFVDEYRLQDGVQVAFRSRQVLMGMQEMIFTVESMEHNVAIPDSIFALPAEIQALVAKQAQDAAPAE